MARSLRPTLTLAQVLHDGPPVRVSDLAAVSGLSHRKVLADISAGDLESQKRVLGRKPMHLVSRAAARLWLLQLGFNVERIAQSSHSSHSSHSCA